MSQEINTSVKVDEIERARQLRREAELLEQKAGVRARLLQLQEISKDPYYDQYLGQLLKDLESGKATHSQVEQETERSYAKYRQRMATLAQQPLPQQLQTPQSVQMPQPVQAPCPIQCSQSVQTSQSVQVSKQEKKSFEFKIGAQVFSIIGAVFVLVAFILFAFNFMSGLGQGICLYAAAILLVAISEIFIAKKAPKFSHVMTGLGIGGLYAANVANYLVLKVISALIAVIITLLIATITILIAKKKDSTLIRLISVIGCYIVCVIPVNGFESELINFLIITFILLVVNLVGAVFQNKNNQLASNITHIALHIVFSVIFISLAYAKELPNAYIVLYAISSFVFINVLSYQQCKAGVRGIFPLCAVTNGLCIFALFIIGTEGDYAVYPEMAVFVHLIAEALILVVAMVTFLLWDKEDGRRWAQVYYLSLLPILYGIFAYYDLETTISVLAAFLIVKLLSGKKELQVLDCIVTSFTAIVGIGMIFSDGWYCLVFAGALFLSIIRIKRLYLFHELLITFSVFIIINSYLLIKWFDQIPWLDDWQYPIYVVYLFLVFLLFNHLPWLKNKNQLPYNIVSLCIMGFYYLGVFFRFNYLVSTVMMVIGAITIIIVFRKRYGLAMKRKFLLLAGFLAYFSLTSHYESPVIVSILLMAIALACVGVGFKQKDKMERICGLVMAIFVCVKLVICDFREVETMYRVVVFLVVGIIALAISFIYIQLEKSEERKKIEIINEPQIVNEPQQEVSK